MVADQTALKSACLIGKNLRCDGVVGTTFLLQFATLNCKTSDFSVSVLGPNGKALEEDAIHIKAHSNGVFDVRFDTPESGYYVVNTIIDEVPLDGFPILVDTLDHQQIHPRLQSELNGLHSIQERLTCEEVHPLAYPIFVDSKTREVNAALEKIQQAKVSAAGLLSVVSNHCDGYVGQNYTMYLPTVNVHLGDFEVRISNSLGKPLVEHPALKKNDNGIVEVSFTVTELCLHVIHLFYKGTPWTPIFLHVFSARHYEAKPELQELFSALAQSRAVLSAMSVPVFNDETSFWEFLKNASLNILELSSKLAEHRIKRANAIGPFVRYDVVEHKPFSLQIATVNGKISEFKDVRVTYKGRRVDGVHLKDHTNGVVELIVPINGRGRYKIEVTFNGEKLTGTPIILHAVSAERAEGNASGFAALEKIHKEVNRTVLPCGNEELDAWISEINQKLEAHLTEMHQKHVTQHGRDAQTPKKSRVGGNFVIETVTLEDLEISEVSFSLTHEDGETSSPVVTKMGDDRSYAIGFIPKKSGNYTLCMYVKDENDVFVGSDDFTPVTVEVFPSPEIFLVSPVSLKPDSVPGVVAAGVPGPNQPSVFLTLDVVTEADTEEISVTVNDPTGNKVEAKIVAHQVQGLTGNFLSAIFTPNTQGRYTAEVFVDGVSVGIKVALQVQPVCCY